MRVPRMYGPLLLVVSILCASPAAPQGAPSAAKTLQVAEYLNYETVLAPRISPDGTQVVYTRRGVNRIEDKWDAHLWIVRADGSRNRFLAKGSDAVWSPDGTRIAYIAEGEPKGAQIFVRWMDADGAPTQVTQLDHPPADLGWSPDGKHIGFSSIVPKKGSWDIPMPKAPEGAKWTKAPDVIDRLHYRQDRRGYTEPGYTHLFIVAGDGGTPRALTSGEWNVGARFDALSGAVGWDWSPDGRTIVVEGLDVPDGDLKYREADIYAIDVATGTRRKLVAEAGTWTNPRFSPDGRQIALTGHPATKASYRSEELYVVNADGSGFRKLSGDYDRDAVNLQWAPDGSGIYFNADDRGSSNIQFAPLSGAVRAVTSGAHMLSLSSRPAKGIAVGVLSSPHRPPDVVRIDLTESGRLTPLTRVNDDLLGSVTLGDVEEIWFASTGGTKVQGWIVKPPSFDPARRYPLIMEIHGGPHSMYSVAFNYMFQSLAANDHVVLYTNPRGSTGYGSAFGNAIERAYPGVDYDDLMAAVDAVRAKGFIDDTRMYVGGCSGGGVLSSWVIGHTDRFAAAAVRCPVTNWVSFLGHTDVPYFTSNFFAAPFWEDPGPWLKRSPLMHVGKVDTPTLLMTGILDLRTPMAQTEEYYTALKLRGVPAKLLRFHGEYHGTSTKPSNYMRTVLYMLDWYKQHTRRTQTSSR